MSRCRQPYLRFWNPQVTTCNPPTTTTTIETLIWIPHAKTLSPPRILTPHVMECLHHPPQSKTPSKIKWLGQYIIRGPLTRWQREILLWQPARTIFRICRIYQITSKLKSMTNLWWLILSLHSLASARSLVRSIRTHPNTPLRGS